MGGKEHAIGERLGSAESADVGLDQPLGAQFESDLRCSRIVSFCRAVSLSFSLSPSIFLSFPPVGTRARPPVWCCICVCPSFSLCVVPPFTRNDNEFRPVKKSRAFLQTRRVLDGSCLFSGFAVSRLTQTAEVKARRDRARARPARGGETNRASERAPRVPCRVVGRVVVCVSSSSFLGAKSFSQRKEK